MILPNELLQIPTPFDDLARLREKPNQAEGVDPIERKTGKCAIRDIRCDGCAHGINDFAPADGFADNMRPDGIPVNERKRDAMVVENVQDLRFGQDIRKRESLIACETSADRIQAGHGMGFPIMGSDCMPQIPGNMGQEKWPEMRDVPGVGAEVAVVMIPKRSSGQSH